MKSAHRAPAWRRFLTALVGLAAGMLAAPVLAEDIDIFAEPNNGSDLPNVLFVLDDSANWSSSISAPNCYYKDNGVLTTNGPKATSPGQEQGKKVAIEKCALYNLIDALPVNPNADADHNALFNVGFLLLNESPYNGAYPRKAFTPLTTNNKAALKTLIASFSILADKGNNADFAKAMYEAYLYFKGLAPYQGQLAPKRDRTAFTAGGLYNSPATASCAHNYVIFIANGSPQSGENNDAKALLSGAGGDTTKITYPNSVVTNSDQANWADEFARFMRNADVSNKDGMQSIITHGVAVTGASSDGLYPNFIRSMANYGGGSYHSASDADTLLKFLLDVFNDIQAVNSVFASASLPVSMNSRGTYLNQVFMGMFRPDASAAPRWRGNMKQYQFAFDSLGNLSLVDSAGVPAVSSSTGFIAPSAVSFWTTPSTFWTNQPMGTPATASDSPDGEVVEKGAAAQMIRSAYATSQSGRRVYTCVGCGNGTQLGSDASTLFSTGNALITAGLLGVASTARDPLIDWVRGTDNAGDEAGPTTTPATTIRPSAHGDVLHSRPAVVNYGGSIGVIVFYGANDGMLHAIGGNQSGSYAGNELWSFVPSEMFGKLNRLRANSPEIRTATTSPLSSATPRDYFVDGPIGIYQRLASDGSVAQAMIFVGMRRGGRVIYAFDVTDPTQPKFAWKKSNVDLPLLGQTWSEPRVVRVRGRSNPVVVLGAGYDATAEDATTPGTTTMGNAIYVLDAFDGSLVKTFGTQRSVAGDVTLVDSDFDGYVDRGYAADLSGRVYRIDFETASSASTDVWSIYTIADLSGGTTTGRKFFFSPDVVVTKSFAALMLGSGDREKPLLSATTDHFFEVFDRNIAKGAPAVYAPVTFDQLVPADGTSNISTPGCYVALDQGEKVVNAATTIAGTSYFGTNRPTPAGSTNSCTADLGIAKAYAMPLFCTAPSGTTLTGGGLPPSPVSGVVTIGSGDNARKAVFVIGAPNPKKSGIEGSRVNPVIQAPRTRIYWYQETSR